MYCLVGILMEVHKILGGFMNGFTIFKTRLLHFLGKLIVRTTQSQAAKVLWLKIDTDNSSVKDYVT